MGHARHTNRSRRSRERSVVSERRPGNPGRESLTRSPTGIRGFDEITSGGLPRGRTSLLVGGANARSGVVRCTSRLDGRRRGRGQGGAG